MNVLILAAGYATRLYPLTENKAKPLLEVAGKPMIEWVLDNLATIPGLGTVYVVTNDKFASDCQEWADSYTTDAHKWLLTGFDATLFWVADSAALTGALSILPEYLRNPAT